jgi:hypothetical protein
MRMTPSSKKKRMKDLLGSADNKEMVSTCLHLCIPLYTLRDCVDVWGCVSQCCLCNRERVSEVYAT